MSLRALTLRAVTVQNNGIASILRIPGGRSPI